MWNRFLMVMGLLLLPSFAEGKTDTFGRLDTDTSGGVNLEEFKQGMPSMRDKAFELIDADGNGSISRAEWDTFYASHAKDNAGAMSFSKSAQQDTPVADDVLLIKPPKNK